MAKISHIPRHEQYTALREDSMAFNECRDCSVVAVAAVTGLPYAEVHAVFASLGRKSKYGVSTYIIRKAVEQLGFQHQQIAPYHFIGQYPGVHKTLQSVTTHHCDRFPGAWADGQSYLIYTAGHVGAIVNGVNIDWTRGKAKRAQWIDRVFRNES
jgi:hypothetical protein